MADKTIEDVDRILRKACADLAAANITVPALYGAILLLRLAAVDHDRRRP
jgi:hypothetical protein